MLLESVSTGMANSTFVSHIRHSMAYIAFSLEYEEVMEIFWCMYAHGKSKA